MNKTNQNITLHGNAVSVTGRELKEGDTLPSFKLTANDMSDLESSSFAGKTLVVCSVPSLDTPVCSVQTARFNAEAANLGDNVAILVVSMDLPFAQARWCGAENAEAVVTASDFKYRGFGENFGTLMNEVGILCRAVFVADPNGKICHVEYVKEISEEPDYDSALSAVKAATGA